MDEDKRPLPEVAAEAELIAFDNGGWLVVANKMEMAGEALKILR